jgi:hypothetical protein
MRDAACDVMSERVAGDALAGMIPRLAAASSGIEDVGGSGGGIARQERQQQQWECRVRVRGNTVMDV